MLEWGKVRGLSRGAQVRGCMGTHWPRGSAALPAGDTQPATTCAQLHVQHVCSACMVQSVRGQDQCQERSQRAFQQGAFTPSVELQIGNTPDKAH
eukprot:407670-Pelagomonas_calceolata.AAC.2